MNLPKIQPVMLTIEVDGLPPLELRALTRAEMSAVLSNNTAEQQDEVMTAVLGGTEEAHQWYQDLPHPIAMALAEALFDATLRQARATEVAQAGESSGGGLTSASASASQESLG